MSVPLDPPNIVTIDGARDPSFREWRRSNTSRALSLYEPENHPAAPWGPWLLRPRDDPSVARIWAEGWGKSWGVAWQSDVSDDVLRRHFRRLLLVELPRGRRAIFRFYDPRVLRAFLPTCTDEERRAFFGPLTAAFVEFEDAARVLRFTAASKHPEVLGRHFEAAL